MRLYILAMASVSWNAALKTRRRRSEKVGLLGGVGGLCYERLSTLRPWNAIDPAAPPVCVTCARGHDPPRGRDPVYVGHHGVSETRVFSLSVIY